MVPTKSVLSDRLIVYTKSRKQLLHRKKERIILYVLLKEPLILHWLQDIFIKKGGDI